MAVRDEKHQEMYLRMYEKGQQTALKERQEEVGILCTVYIHINTPSLFLEYLCEKIKCAKVT